MSHYKMNDGHRLFLQSFMSRGILNAKEVKQLFKICCLKYNLRYTENEKENQEALKEFVRTVNHHTEPLHMQIRKGVCEDDGTSSYGLVCTSESTITKLASDYTPSELEFFKKLIEIIVASKDAEVGSTEALNLVSRLENVKKLSKDDAEDLLSRLETNKWIKMTRGKISLATRSLLELDHYIQEIYQEDVSQCNICKKLCLKGQTCFACGTKLHFHCASKLFERDEFPKCPKQGCKKPWSHDIRRTPRKEEVLYSRSPEKSQRKRKADVS
ncbi:non-structural maintenance of chromosomes element 1 homolog [Ostrea edulis]|uniref:non-structural maintenance of chromosomes element 1 homolog n=1 Tax=Ostrea edulis TaxID=37623 RepID=UPI0024AFC267|nr:non-structural maintenance of chromosomes element 1 homolog [Ostrea edulis]XP_048764033.2 non-structural maintenance of chromosomes element 1 homolog [Ostrea edulis]